MALAMTLNGAAGETYTQMQNTLGLTGLTNAEINQSYQNLIAMFSSLDPNVTFNIANSIWYRNTFNVLSSFTSTNSKYFDAKVAPLNFDDPNAANTINSWVSQKTNGKISDVVGSKIPASTIMYLINTLYFHGTWEYRFPYSDTKPGTFYLADGGTETDSMMTINDTLNYCSDQNFEAVELPYGNGDYSMMVLLPADSINSGDPIPVLTQSELNNIYNGFRKVGITVTLPKFKLSYKIGLDSILSVMGMPDAFSPQSADFTRINPNGGLYISSVLHKTYIDVDEAGTEAAAVTVVVIGATVVTRHPTFDADRPFIFLIKENHNNTIMFMGAVTQPGTIG